MDTLLRPLHRWVWSDAHRRAHKLLRFAETEADGGRDIARAAELTGDGAPAPPLPPPRAWTSCGTRTCSARAGARSSRRSRGRPPALEANWFAPGERGLDDLNVDREKDDSLLAFLHLSERAAAMRFAVYREVLGKDPETRDVFESILRDEAFHMNYTRKQLERVSPRRHGLRLWAARLHRLWKVYLRFAAAFASVMGGVILTVQYFVVLPVFAFAAKRAGAARGCAGGRDARRETAALVHGTQYG